MLERLAYVKLAPKRILDAGAGPAPQAASLLKRYRGATLLALDFSLPMLQARPGRGWLNRLAGRAAPVPVCADLSRMPLASRCCSLVWSNMALHWAADPQRAIEEFHRVLEVEGLLMFSTIGPDTGAFPRPRNGEEPLMNLSFRTALTLAPLPWNGSPGPGTCQGSSRVS